MPDAGRGVSVVLLAKHADQAKTRLRLPAASARTAALALAARTVRAATQAQAVGAVHIVTSDRTIAADALGAGADVVWEGPRPLGINRAGALGRDHALRVRADAHVAILVADLPYVRAVDLDDVLEAYDRQGSPGFVADHLGTGTTMLVHGPGSRLGIGFGYDSASMHRRLGYRELRAQGRGLRHDLDTAEDLAQLRRAPHTSRATRQAEWMAPWM
jgi:2-phospho-L-lactate guanylyltransferase